MTGIIYQTEVFNYAHLGSKVVIFLFFSIAVFALNITEVFLLQIPPGHSIDIKHWAFQLGIFPFANREVARDYIFFTNRPCSICQYSRLLGQSSIFGVVFFVSKSL